PPGLDDGLREGDVATHVLRVPLPGKVGRQLLERDGQAGAAGWLVGPEEPGDLVGREVRLPHDWNGSRRPRLDRGAGRSDRERSEQEKKERDETVKSHGRAVADVAGVTDEPQEANSDRLRKRDLRSTPWRPRTASASSSAPAGWSATPTTPACSTVSATPRAGTPVTPR